MFDTASLRLLLDGLHQITAERLARTDPDDSASTDRVHRAMRELARSVSGTIVVLLIGSYIALLSPAMALAVVLIGFAHRGAGRLLGQRARPPGSAAPLDAGPDAARAAGEAAACLAAACADDTRLAVQSAIGLLGVGFVSISAPVLAGSDPSVIARVVVAALLLWTTTLFLMRSAPADTSPAQAHAMPRGAADPVPWQPTTVTLAAQGAHAEMRIRIAPGLVLLVTGDNGSGKSELFRRLAGRTPTWDGTAAMLSDPPLAGPEAAEQLRRMTALVTETPALPDIPGAAAGRAALAAILPLAGLPTAMLDDDGVLHSRNVSRIQQMRVGLALGVFARSPVLLLDGFLNGQDVPFRRHFVAATLPLLRSAGCCTVVSAIDPDILPEADGRFTLQNGHLVPA